MQAHLQHPLSRRSWVLGFGHAACDENQNPSCTVMSPSSAEGLRFMAWGLALIVVVLAAAVVVVVVVVVVVADVVVHYLLLPLATTTAKTTTSTTTDDDDHNYNCHRHFHCMTTLPAPLCVKVRNSQHKCCQLFLTYDPC